MNIQSVPGRLTRTEAREQGVKFYWTGKPCCNGHIDFRYTDHKQCLSCAHAHAHARNNSNAYAKGKDKTVVIVQPHGNPRQRWEQLRDELALKRLLNEEYGDVA